MNMYFFVSSYITNLMENAPEGTTLSFEGGLDMVEDLDKVGYQLTTCLIIYNT